jgi:hypothetical protein
MYSIGDSLIPKDKQDTITQFTKFLAHVSPRFRVRRCSSGYVVAQTVARRAAYVRRPRVRFSARQCGTEALYEDSNEEK